MIACIPSHHDQRCYQGGREDGGGSGGGVGVGVGVDGVGGRVFAEKFGLGRGSCLFPIYKINPNPTTIICGGKKWPKCRFYPNFSRVGLALGWRVRRFHDNI